MFSPTAHVHALNFCSNCLRDEYHITQYRLLLAVDPIWCIMQYICLVKGYIYIGIKRETNKQKKLKRGKVSIRKSFLWNMKTFFSIRKIRNKSFFFIIILLLRVWFEIIPFLKSVLYNESFQNHCYTFYFFLLLNYYTSCKCLKSANLMITLITKLIYFLSENKGSRGS